ncbi:MAG: hypothetical protein EB017_08210, partial [Betaproteobacteria bacterium]|nr:hypothetical protein [Betaproteobacteria bacterium]
MFYMINIKFLSNHYLEASVLNVRCPRWLAIEFCGGSSRVQHQQNRRMLPGAPGVDEIKIFAKLGRTQTKQT